MNAGDLTSSKGSVVLVHGIRTHAEWYRDVRDTLQGSGYKVYLTNYGRFDLVRFLLPFPFFRNRSKEKIIRQIRDARKSDPNADFSIIAHSFGTYVVSRILQDEFDIRVKRIIFVGSVVRYDFPFEQFSERFEGQILNEVAAKDPWPAFAESITTGYGSAGTFGFKRPRVVDRWHGGGHSTILNAQYCVQFWLPFLDEGAIVQTTDSPHVPFWIRLLNFLRLKYWIVLAIALFLVLSVAVARYAAPTVPVQMFPGNTGWRLSDNHIAAVVNASMDEVCPVGWLLRDRCAGWLGRYITKRSWRGVHRYDQRLNDVLFPNDWIYTYQDPERFWYDLADAYPNCVSITEVGDDLDISYDERCALPMVH